MDCFTIEKLSFSYPEQAQKALDEVSFSLPAGQFVTLCGSSGCGKTTLLRLLKPVLAPHGKRAGEIFFQGAPLAALSPASQAAQIGFVLQSAENQIVTDRVWHELAFGLESLGYDTPTIRARVAEMASFFGIEHWFYQDVASLSGGQKQLLNLASVMAMQPSVLLLDEPTAQLDPIAAGEFLTALSKINRELGTTILLSEHRLEETFPLSDRVVVLEAGRVIADSTPQQVGEALRQQEHAMSAALPTPMRIWAAVAAATPCPLTVRQGRAWLDAIAAEQPLLPCPLRTAEMGSSEPILRLRDVWFKYEQDSPDVIKGLSLTLARGELLAILGGNGAGKSTALSLIAGLRKPYRGKIDCALRVAMLPQNPQALFVKKTVAEDLTEGLRGSKLTLEEKERRIQRVVRLCALQPLLERHPYDLSGGEQQRAALAKVLLLEPELLLLDEPTKGLDAAFKQVLAQILQALRKEGRAIILVSHDVEFCAAYAPRCALFFDGSLVTEAPSQSFFSGNRFYTTAANRMARQHLPQAVTADDVIAALGGTLPQLPLLPEELDAEGRGEEDSAPAGPRQTAAAPAKRQQPLPWWRKLLAAICGTLTLAAMLYAIRQPGITEVSWSGLAPYLLVLVGLSGLAAAISRKRAPLIQTPREKRTLSRRTRLALFLILLLIPLTLYVGVYFLGERKYYFISLLILLEAMLPFAFVFEGRKPQARELVLIAALCGLGVAGRAAFFMLPQFKPLTALVILAGVAFGGEVGFLVGALSMLTSNMLFSQGPWTPWQMFALGIIGFFSGLLFRKGWLRRGRLPLAVFGALATIVIYGGIMNPASAIMWQATLNRQILLAYYATGLPFDLVHAASSFLFLWLLSEPMLEKMDRIKLKYGLVE